MNKIVWKHVIPDAGFVFKVSLPEGAEIIHVGYLHPNAFFWAWVDPNAPLWDREFIVMATGIALPEGKFKHQGSFIIDRDATIWHLFEKLG